MPHNEITLRLSPLHIWLLTIINLLVILGVLVMMGPFKKDAGPASALAKTSASTTPDDHDLAAAPDEDALNGFGKAVLRAGLPHCALAMNQLADRVLVGHKVGGYRFPITENGFGSFSMEVVTKSGGVAYMTFNMAETDQQRCIISYEAVSQWENKCEDVVKNVLKDFQPTRMLGERITILTHKDNPQRKVFTMPIHQGCIATEKEIILSADTP